MSAASPRCARAMSLPKPTPRSAPNRPRIQERTRGLPMNDNSDTPIRRAGSYLGLPQRADAKGAHAAILGIPFDCGRHPTRIGSRLGPAVIRAQSPLVLEQLGDSSVDIIGTLGLVD